MDAAYFVSKSEGRSKRTSRHWNWTGHSRFWFSLMVSIYWARTYKKSARALIITVKDDDLEIKAERSTYGSVFATWRQTVGQNYSVKITSKWFESVAKARYLKKTLASQNCTQEKSKSRLNWGNTCYHFDQNVLSFHLLPQKLNSEVYVCCFVWAWNLVCHIEWSHRQRMYKNRILGKYLDLRGSRYRNITISCSMRHPRQILLGWSNSLACDRQCLWHTWA
jgi:hypothetical protein